jgi:hypothetical protein
LKHLYSPVQPDIRNNPNQLLVPSSNMNNFVEFHPQNANAPVPEDNLDNASECVEIHYDKRKASPTSVSEDDEELVHDSKKIATGTIPAPAENSEI